MVMRSYYRSKITTTNTIQYNATQPRLGLTFCFYVTDRNETLLIFYDTRSTHSHHSDKISDISAVGQVARGPKGNKKKRYAGHGPAKRRREPMSHAQVHGILAFVVRMQI